MVAEAGTITRSFKALRTLADIFDSPSVRSIDEKKAIHLARRLGGTAVPLLLRKLLGEEREASLAYLLFSYVGAERATAALREVALDTALPDDKRALAIALLGERDAVPTGIRLADEDGLRRRAALALAGRLETAADVARAADLLVEQVSPEDLPLLMQGLVESSGARMSPLVDELLLRDEPTRPVKTALRELRRRIGDPVVPPASIAAAARIQMGRAGDGSKLVVASAPQTTKPDAERLLVLTISRKGLGAASYDAEARHGSWHHALSQAATSGYALRPCSVGRAATAVAEAARRTRRAGARLPRAYYLGRDLLGLSDEHAAVDAAGGTRSLHVKPVSLARGTALLSRGHLPAARRAFAAYVAARPEDAEGRSCLGLCLLQLGEAEEALRELARAARLEPDEPLRHWNLAAAARQTGKPGTCYLALLDYVRVGERGRGTAQRRRSALEFIDMFARFAATEHAGASPETLARGEEIFDRAYRHLVAGRFEDAITGFEAVVQLVPSHYASWGNLGAAYARVNKLAEAERCLRRALEVRPDYEPAQRNLEAITAEV